MGEKICPIRSKDTGADAPCVGSKCEWWTFPVYTSDGGNTGGCAVRMIAQKNKEGLVER